MNFFEMANAQAAKRKANAYRLQFPSFERPIGSLNPPAQPVHPQPVALMRPQPVQPAPAQAEADALVREAVGLAIQAGLKAWEPKWQKRSPGSLLIYKLCDEVAASSSITPEAKAWLTLVKFGAFLYGLDESDN